MGNLEFLKSKITKFTENGQNQCQRNDVQEKSKSESKISRKLQNPYIVCTHFQSRSCSRQLVTSKLKIEYPEPFTWDFDPNPSPKTSYGVLEL